MHQFSNLELVKEYPGWFLNGTKALRIYRSKDSNEDGSFTYRFHFGYPKELVEPLYLLLETTPYWGEQHWLEIDGFWLWWTSITNQNGEYPNPGILNRENGFRRQAFAACLNFYMG